MAKYGLDSLATDATPPTEPTEGFAPIQMRSVSEATDPSLGLEAQKKLAQKHIDRFEDWQTWRKPMEDLWSTIYSLYMTTPQAAKLPTRSKVVIPAVFQGIETAVPKLFSIIFGQTDFFSTAPDKENPTPDEWDVAKNKHRLIKDQLYKAKFLAKFIDFAKQLFLYGTSYFYVYWKVKREWTYEREAIRTPKTFFGIPVGEELTWNKELKYKVTERRPEIDVLAIEDVYPDPEARTEDDAEGIYVISSINKEELKAMSTGRFATFTNYDMLEAEAVGKPDPSRFKQDKRSLRGMATTESSSGTSKDSVELLTWWGKEDLDGDGIREECQIVIANKKVLIKAIRNPFEHQKRPVVRVPLFPVPLEWYGMGLVEPAISQVHELSTIHNQVIDANNLIINRMWKVSTLADVDLDTLISSPNGIILTDDMKGVEPIETGALPFSPVELSRMIQTDIETTMAPKSLQGAPDSGSLGRTAKGATLIISQALEKFGMGAKLTEYLGVEPVLRMFDQLNQQFLDSDDLLNDPNGYGKIFLTKMTPEAIRQDVSYKMLGLADTITKEASINQMIAFVNVFKGLPGLNLIEVAKSVWNMMGVSKSADEVITPAPFPQTQVMNMLPDQGGASAPGGAMGQMLQNGASAPVAQ